MKKWIFVLALLATMNFSVNTFADYDCQEVFDDDMNPVDNVFTCSDSNTGTDFIMYESTTSCKDIDGVKTCLSGRKSGDSFYINGRTEMTGDTIKEEYYRADGTKSGEQVRRGSFSYDMMSTSYWDAYGYGGLINSEYQNLFDGFMVYESEGDENKNFYTKYAADGVTKISESEYKYDTVENTQTSYTYNDDGSYQIESFVCNSLVKCNSENYTNRIIKEYDAQGNIKSATSYDQDNNQTTVVYKDGVPLSNDNSSKIRRRIYTIDEANAVAGKVNSVKIRYR